MLRLLGQKPSFKWLIMLSNKISRKPRFNTFWELGTGPLIKVERIIFLPWKHVFSGSGKFSIHSNIFPQFPPILVFWDNEGKTVSTINTSTEAVSLSLMSNVTFKQHADSSYVSSLTNPPSPFQQRQDMEIDQAKLIRQT